MNLDSDSDTQRLQRIAAESADTNEVRIECVYGAHVVRFAISALELQHLTPAVIYGRYFANAWEALHVPAPVVTDVATSATEEGTVVVVGNP